jgi:hypothetical protein
LIVLEEDARHALVQHLAQLGARQADGDQHHLGLQTGAAEEVHHLVAAAVAEFIVEQDQVRLHGGQLRHGLFHGGALGHHLQAGLRVEQARESFAKQGVVVHQHYARHTSPSLSPGSRPLSSMG